MNMKRIGTLSLAALLLVGVVAGCAPKAPAETAPVAKTPEEMTTAYKTAIEAARTEDDNKYSPLVTSPEDEGAQMMMDVLGVKAEDMTAYAFSASVMMTQAYGVAAIMPAEGKSEAILTAVNAFVALQQQNFAQYLPDQNEIAKAAKVETLADGTILLVMCADQDTVLTAIKDGLSK